MAHYKEEFFISERKVGALPVIKSYNQRAYRLVSDYQT